MTIKQLSIFVTDKAGSLAEVLDILKQGGHQILTSTLADTQDFSIYRVLCTETDKAYETLRAAGVHTMLQNVIALAVDDEPGAAAKAIRVLSDANISIRYMYSFLLSNKGILVIRPDQQDKALEVCMLNKLHLASESMIASLAK